MTPLKNPGAVHAELAPANRKNVRVSRVSSLIFSDYSKGYYPGLFFGSLSASCSLAMLFLGSLLDQCRCGGIRFLDAASAVTLRNPPGPACEGTLLY